MAQPFTSGTGRALKPHLPLSMLTGSAKVTSWGLRMQQGGAEAGAGHGSDRESRGWVGGAALVKDKLLFTIPRWMTLERLAAESQACAPDTPSVG